MSNSVRPHRWQPTRLPHPWDSPGKNTGVGCHFLLQCKKVKSESEVAQPCLTSRSHELQPTRLLRPWDFPGKSTGVGCHCLLQKESWENHILENKYDIIFGGTYIVTGTLTQPFTSLGRLLSLFTLHFLILNGNGNYLSAFLCKLDIVYVKCPNKYWKHSKQ